MKGGRTLAIAMIAGSVCAAPAAGQDSHEITVNTARAETLQILLNRGKQSLNLGDISGARRLLKPPAESGSREAARCLGESYDPQWLAAHQASLPNLIEVATAVIWYRRAAQLGDAAAITRLKELEP